VDAIVAAQTRRWRRGPLGASAGNHDPWRQVELADPPGEVAAQHPFQLQPLGFGKKPITAAAG
jgi:hypothetical protein